MACRFDQTLRRLSAPMTLCRVASSQGRDGGTITGSTSTSPENGAGKECAASTLSIFTCQVGTTAPGDSCTYAEHPPNE